MSRSRRSGIVEDELTISFLFCDIKLHFTSLSACFDYLTSTYPPIRDPTGVPAFLFRGEPGIYDATYSRRTRIELELWERPEYGQKKVNELVEYCEIELGRLKPRLTPDEIMPFLQHYGLPTPGLDLTSDLETVAYFGSFGETNRIKVIAAIDTQKLLKVRGGLTRLNSDEFGSRPQKQHAYVSRLEHFDNLKAPQFSRPFGITWYSFVLTEDDKYKFNSGKAYLSEGDSNNMNIVSSLITGFESLYGKMPRKIKRLYADSIAQCSFSTH